MAHNNHCTIYGKEYDLSSFRNQIVTQENIDFEQQRMIAFRLYDYVGSISLHTARQIIKQIADTGEVPKLIM